MPPVALAPLPGPAATASAVKAPGFFDGVSLAPTDPILGVNEAYLADGHSGKISLGVGAYRTDEGLPYVLPVVKQVEQQIVCTVDRSNWVWVGGWGASGDACSRLLVAVLVEGALASFL